MVLKAGEREIELLFKSVRMEQLGDKLGGDTHYKLQEAAFDGNIKILAMLIKQFSNEFSNTKDGDETKGVYAFIDEMLENNTIGGIYADIFEGINDKGFFTQKLEVGALPVSMKRMTKDMTDMVSAEMTSTMVKSQIGASLSAVTAEQPTQQG